jgi:hypothetical protein
MHHESTIAVTTYRVALLQLQKLDQAFIFEDIVVVGRDALAVRRTLSIWLMDSNHDFFDLWEMDGPLWCISLLRQQISRWDEFL